MTCFLTGAWGRISLRSQSKGKGQKDSLLPKMHNYAGDSFLFANGQAWNLIFLLSLGPRKKGHGSFLPFPPKFLKAASSLHTKIESWTQPKIIRHFKFSFSSHRVFIFFSLFLSVKRNLPKSAFSWLPRFSHHCPPTFTWLIFWDCLSHSDSDLLILLS